MANKLDALADPYWVAVPANLVDPVMDVIAAARRHEDMPRCTASAQNADPFQGPQSPAADVHHRWRHPGLEKLMTETADRHPDLHAALASTDSVVATNAAILLGRSRDPTATEPLVSAIESPKTNVWQRRAAIEGLADIRQPAIVPRLQKLVDEHGDYSAAARLSYVPEIHADLLRALIQAEFHGDRDATGDGESRLIAALSSPAATVRREALLGLADPKSGPLPANVVRYAADEDRQVRQAAMIALAARYHPEALDVMRRGLVDQDLDVRLAAVAGLGLIGGPRTEATIELKRLTTDSAESVRAAAYRALLELDDPETLAAASADKAWRVRRLAAEALARDASRGAGLADKLIADGNPDVVRQTLDSISNWPLQQAGPILLEAMEGSAYMTRKLAASQLGERWTPAVNFEIDAPAERRERLLAALQRQWKAQFAATMPSPPERVDHEALSQRVVAESTAVERLKTDDVRERRRAAEALRNDFASRPLSQLALDRLADLMARESDALVWVGVFGLLAGDARDPSIRLAYGALGHPSPEVRRRACEHLAAHPAPRHGPLLLVSLEDSNAVVIEAAVKALGRLGSLDDPRPLERLLASPDHELRVEVAEALVHVGAGSGIAALERLAYDSDPKVRRSAAAAMGETPDASFLPDLIHLLDDRPEIRRAALASLPRVTGRNVPPPESPATGSSLDGEPQRWKEWFRHQTAVNLGNAE